MGSGVLGEYVASRAAVPDAQKEWVQEMQRRLLAVERKTEEVAKGGAKVSGALAAWAPLVSQIDSLAYGLDDVRSLGESANGNALDTVTWSEKRPVSPKDDGSVAGADVPANPDSTWFVYHTVNGGRQVKEVWRWVPPTFEHRPDGTQDVEGEWVQEKFGTDTLGEGAVDLANLSAALSNDVTTSKNAVSALQNRQNKLEQDYAKQKTDLEKKIDDLQVAAGSDGRTIVSDTEPQGADRKAGNLWVNTAGGQARPYAFNSGANAWVPLASKAAQDAASGVVAARASAAQALSAAQTAQDKATAAELAAQSAQRSADGKNSVFYSPDKPALAGRVNGDLWYDTDDGYRMHIYSASSRDFIRADVVASMSPADQEALIGRAVQRVSAQFENIDAGKITSGVLNAQRIAAGSITSAKVDIGDLQANVVRTANLDAGKITTGRLSAAVVDVETLRGKVLEGGTVRGGVVEGAIVRSGSDANNRITLDTAFSVRSGGQETVRISPSGSLQLRNPKSGQLSPLSDIVFGIQFGLSTSTVNVVNVLKYTDWFGPWNQQPVMTYTAPTQDAILLAPTIRLTANGGFSGDSTLPFGGWAFQDTVTNQWIYPPELYNDGESMKTHLQNGGYSTWTSHYPNMFNATFGQIRGLTVGRTYRVQVWIRYLNIAQSSQTFANPSHTIHRMSAIIIPA